MSGAYHIKDREAFCAKRKAVAADPAVRAKQSVASKAAWAARRATTTWQPISTAPRDGSAILVFGKPSDLVMGGNTLVAFKKAAAYTAAWDEIDQTFCLSGGSWLGPFVEPTHWMPLPAPPAED